MIKVEVNFLEKDKFEVLADTTGVKFCIDKKHDEYDSCGPNPLEVFLSSLGSCIGVFAKMYLMRHSIVFKELRMEVNAELAHDRPMRLINIKVRVHTDAALEGKREPFMKFIEACPIHSTIINTDKVEIELA